MSDESSLSRENVPQWQFQQPQREANIEAYETEGDVKGEMH